MLPIALAATNLIASGSDKNMSGSTTGSGTDVTFKDFMDEGALERQAREAQSAGLTSFEDMLKGGPSLSQFQQQGLSASNDLASLLEQLRGSGGMPGAQDWSQAQSFAQQATAPQAFQNELAMRQSEQAQARQAALSGRSGMDFTFQRGLAQQRSDLAGSLGAQQSAISSQIAQQLPMQRLGFAQDLAQLRQGLASQAMQNRQAIMSLGSNIQGQQFGMRERQATTTVSRNASENVNKTLEGAFTKVDKAFRNLTGGARLNAGTINNMGLLGGIAGAVASGGGGSIGTQARDTWNKSPLGNVVKF